MTNPAESTNQNHNQNKATEKAAYKAPETPEYIPEKFEWKLSDLRPLIVFFPIAFMMFVCITFFSTAMLSAFFNG